jgi:hypothetical protein
MQFLLGKYFLFHWLGFLGIWFSGFVEGVWKYLDLNRMELGSTSYKDPFSENFKVKLDSYQLLGSTSKNPFKNPSKTPEKPC